MPCTFCFFVPRTYDKKAGITGNVQGEANESKPAMRATIISNTKGALNSTSPSLTN